MKFTKILISVTIVSSVLFVSMADAARTFRFRGSSATNFEAYKKRLAERRSQARAGERRSISRSRHITRKSSRPTSRYSLRRSSVRGRQYSSITGGKRPELARTRERVALKSVSANSLPFYISVPEGFEKISDSLDWSTGKMVLEKGSSKIEITASADRCHGGSTSQRLCLSGKAQEFGEELQAEFPSFEVDKSKTVFLRTSVVNPNKKSAAKYLTLEGHYEKAGLLTFLDPENQFIWTMKMTSPNEKNSLLNDNMTVQKMFYSLFKKPKSTTTSRDRRSRVQINPTPRKTSYVKRRKTSRLGQVRTQLVRAENIPFQFRVPRDFNKVSDTLNYESGEILLRSDDSAITIMATDEQCQDQTYSLVLRCVKEFSDSFTNEITGGVSGPKIMLDETNLSQMTFKQKVNKDVGQYVLTRSSSRERKALFTFREPVNGYIWKIKIESPEKRGAFLNDVRNARKLITSLLFREE